MAIIYRLATSFWVSICTASTGFVGCAQKASYNKDDYQKASYDTDDYLKAYYNVVKNGFLMNIPTLEAHENFLRNIWLICLLYLITVLADCCQSSISEIICQYSKCAIAMFLLLLIVFIPFVWYKIQMKIFELVWEGDYYANKLKNETCDSQKNKL